MNNKKEFTCWISLCPHGRLDRRRRGRRYGTLEHRVEDLWPEDGETSNHDGQNDERLAFRQLGRHVSFFSSQGKRGPLVEREDERNVVERLGLSMMATTADFLFFSPSSLSRSCGIDQRDRSPKSTAHDYIQPTAALLPLAWKRLRMRTAGLTR